MAQFPAIISLADIDGANGFRIEGESARAALGTSVASAGDVNGDGFTDIVLGDYGKKTAYVIFGSAEGFGAQFDLKTLDGHNGFEIDGSHLGLTVSSAGDVNGDGFDDVLVGSWRLGADFLIYGKVGGFDANLNLENLDGADGTRFDHSTYWSGWQVSSAGDVNGDGFDDMIFGCVGSYFGSGNYAGGTSVVFGNAAGFDAKVSLHDMSATVGFIFLDADQYDHNGQGVSAAGDVNGDGFDDMFVSASSGPDGYKSHIVFGHAGNFGSYFDLANIDGSNGFTIDAGDRQGTLAPAGDVNGDGLADVIVGNSSATSYVVFGARSFDANVGVSSLDGADGFAIEGSSARTVVSSAGDVNGDGFDDLLIGARYADTAGQNSGASYVVFGQASGLSAHVDLETLDGTDGFRVDGEAAGDFSGDSVASGGDINNDGLDDLIIGSPGADDGGIAYIVYGVLPDAKVNRVGTDASQSLVGGNFNDKLAGRDGGDWLWGNGGKDKLFGQDGDDVLRGGDGEDQLTGGSGDDTLVGGLGRDRMTGSDELNSFVFISVADSPASTFDIITDLHKGDRIDLSAIDADATQDGDQAFHQVKHFGRHTGELVLSWNSATNITTLQADVDGDRQADFAVELLGKHDAFHGLVL